MPSSKADTIPTWRDCLFDAIALVVVIVTSATAGYLLGGIQ